MRAEWRYCLGESERDIVRTRNHHVYLLTVCITGFPLLHNLLITRNCAEADVVSITVTHDGVVSSTAYTRCCLVPLFRTASLFATMNNVNTQSFSFLCFVLHIFFLCLCDPHRALTIVHPTPFLIIIIKMVKEHDMRVSRWSDETTFRDALSVAIGKPLENVALHDSDGIAVVISSDAMEEGGDYELKTKCSSEMQSEAIAAAKIAAAKLASQRAERASEDAKANIDPAYGDDTNNVAPTPDRREGAPKVEISPDQVREKVIVVLLHINTCECVTVCVYMCVCACI